MERPRGLWNLADSKFSDTEASLVMASFDSRVLDILHRDESGKKRISEANLDELSDLVNQEYSLNKRAAFRLVQDHWNRNVGLTSGGPGG